MKHAVPHRRTATSTLAFAVLLACSAPAAFAIPDSFVDDSEGFIQFGGGVLWPIGADKPMFGFVFSGAGPQRIGLGFDLYLGEGMGFVSLFGLYYADPIPSELVSCAVKFRLGGMMRGEDFDWFTSLSAGPALYPFMIRYDEEDEEDLGLVFTAEIGLFYFHGGFFGMAGVDACFAMGLAPDEGGWYYVYY